MTNADMPPPSGTAVTANGGSDSLVVAEVLVGGSVKAAGLSKPTGETVTITADDLAITADARAVVTPPLTLDVAVVPPPQGVQGGRPRFRAGVVRQRVPPRGCHRRAIRANCDDR